ncbi:hypothetical protein [Brachybacterium sp. Z12]|uniref:hypothetical protein n=1 Tax=Brachybacterium sp. Z12 TaxID=2759167 RepID=UPI00223AEE0A|nr:hypothetical protein [Brachybacterium sp. Z12]
MALAQGRSKLLLQDRTYFSLDHPAFDTLRELIREGEALAEWEPEHQQISRFQVDMWDDLQQMADETVTSEDWSSTALSLRTLEDSPPPELPAPCRPSCGPTSARASPGSPSCTPTASAVCSPTTWAWARPCRPSP